MFATPSANVATGGSRGYRLAQDAVAERLGHPGERRQVDPGRVHPVVRGHEQVGGRRVGRREHEILRRIDDPAPGRVGHRDGVALDPCRAAPSPRSRVVTKIGTEVPGAALDDAVDPGSQPEADAVAVLGRPTVRARGSGAPRSTPSNSPRVLRIWSTTWGACAPSQPAALRAVGPPVGHLRAGMREQRHVQQERREARLADRARRARRGATAPARSPSGTPSRGSARHRRPPRPRASAGPRRDHARTASRRARACPRRPRRSRSDRAYEAASRWRRRRPRGRPARPGDP